VDEEAMAQKIQYLIKDRMKAGAEERRRKESDLLRIVGGHGRDRAVGCLSVSSLRRLASRQAPINLHSNLFKLCNLDLKFIRFDALLIWILKENDHAAAGQRMWWCLQVEDTVD
jgi:hypothetical protein